MKELTEYGMHNNYNECICMCMCMCMKAGLLNYEHYYKHTIAFRMQNATSGENHECLKHHKGNQSLCLGAQVVETSI